VKEPARGVSIRGASFGYGARRVVEDVELEIAPGAFLAVLGPNGAGKTTLLRGLLGLLPPLAGVVRNEGVTLGYVPQRDRLDPVFPLTVLEVVSMGAFARRTRLRRVRPEDRRAAAESLRRLGLAELVDARFERLSGGQRQRALIARALLERPDVLVLDEPTSGVDGPSQELVLELLADLNGNEGLAVVLVSHQLAMTRVAKDVLWVAGGRVRHVSAEERLAPSSLEDLFAPEHTPGARS